MEKELVCAYDFKKELYECCMEQIVGSLKKIEAFDFIERDRGLMPYERGMKTAHENTLETNEAWILVADPKYTRIQ